jgi:hypothetical protein
MPTIRLVAVTAALALAAPAAAANGDLVLQQGIDGVRLGMTKAQVQAAAGRPLQIERRSGELGSLTTFRYRTFTATFFAGERVTHIRTTSAVDRTASGVGVGTAKSRLRATLAGLRCPYEPGYEHCYLGTWKAGGKVTDFVLRDGGVTQITIGYVVD